MGSRGFWVRARVRGERRTGQDRTGQDRPVIAGLLLLLVLKIL